MKLIFLPGTLTVLDVQSFFVDTIEIVDETVDGDCSWKLSDGTVVRYDEKTDYISFYSDDVLFGRHTIPPQQVADDAPLYWSNSVCMWIEHSCDVLFSLPYLAEDDEVPTELAPEGEVYNLLKEMERYPDDFGLWVFRYLDDDEGKVLQTKFFNDEEAMLEVNNYIDRCECGAQCHLSDKLIDEVLSFVGLPHADSVRSTDNKMVIQPLGVLSMTRLK